MIAGFADWASIVSLGLTLLNTYLIIRIPQRIVLNLTLEPVLSRLMQNSLDMNQYLTLLTYNRIRPNSPRLSADVKPISEP